MASINGQHPYGAPLFSRGTPQGVPSYVSDYIGNVPAEVSAAYTGKHLTPVSLPGVENLGKAVAQSSVSWQVFHQVAIAVLGQELFRLFQVKIIPEDQINVEHTGRIFSVSPMRPTTEHAPGDADSSYGFSFKRTMTMFAKFIQAAVGFQRTEEGRRVMAQQLKQLGGSYVLTVIATLISDLYGMQSAYAAWSRGIPSARTRIPPMTALLESAQLFAASSKGNVDGLMTILNNRCPDANTAIFPASYNPQRLFGEAFRDPDLFPGSTIPVFRTTKQIANIVSVPPLPTGLADETKSLMETYSAYTTFIAVPPPSDSKLSKDGIEVYDHAAKRFAFISRAKLYANVAFDLRASGNVDGNLSNGSVATVFADEIAQCEQKKPATSIMNEGFVLLRVFMWGSMCVIMCDNRVISILSTAPLLLPGVSPSQNTLEVHSRVRIGTEASDAGASVYSLSSSIVKELIGGGSTNFFKRSDLVNHDYHLLDPDLRHCGIVVLLCDKDDIDFIANEICIPVGGSWSGPARSEIGTHAVANINWTTSNSLGRLFRGSYETGAFAIGSYMSDNIPRMPEAALRDACRFVTSSEIQTDAGCAPHGTLTTDEITGVVQRATESSANPDAVTKRIRVHGF